MYFCGCGEGKAEKTKPKKQEKEESKKNKGRDSVGPMEGDGMGREIERCVHLWTLQLM